MEPKIALIGQQLLFQLTPRFRGGRRIITSKRCKGGIDLSEQCRAERSDASLRQ
jgi:hypothetical protein